MAACHNFCITNLKIWHSKLIHMAQKARRVFGKIRLDISFPRESRSLLFRLFHHGVLYKIISSSPCLLHAPYIAFSRTLQRYTYSQQRCSLKHFYPAAEWMLQFGAQLQGMQATPNCTSLHFPTFCGPRNESRAILIFYFNMLSHFKYMSYWQGDSRKLQTCFSGYFVYESKSKHYLHRF